ncbi:MAG: hypothetical protein ACOYOV_09070 [Bacteroidales bacterium]
MGVPITIYQITSRDLEGSIEKMIEKNHKKIIEDSFLNRFDGIEISSKTLCEIWNVTPATLSSYVKFKVIIPVNPGSSKLLFNLKQILEMPNPKHRRFTNVG